MMTDAESRPVQATAAVVENVPIAKDTYRIRLDCNTIAARIRPGQFVMLRLDLPNDPLLGRPFALYDTISEPDGTPRWIDVVYLVVGTVTGGLSRLTTGDRVHVWGPLGNGFRRPGPVGHVAMIAGGIGQTPFLAYARELLGDRGYAGMRPARLAARATLYYGVRNAAYAAGVADFEHVGCDVRLASNDGSAGARGFVTDLIRDEPRADLWVACGPEPMLKAVAGLAAERGIPCDVSLETPMACGLGICFSCVTRVKTSDGWDYKRVCVDGPVFDAGQVVWE